METPIIGYTDYYLPTDYLSTDEYATKLSAPVLEAMGVSSSDLAAILKNSIGVQRIYIEDRANEAKIFIGLLEKYFASGATKPEEIDFIIYTRGNSVSEGDPLSMTEDYCINVPYYLQQQFQMTGARIFNVEQQCSGTLVAAEIAHSFIKNGSARKILVLSGSFFQDMGHRLMGGLGLVSDAAGIMEISTGGTGYGILDSNGATDGSLSMVKSFKQGTNPANMVKIGSELITSLVERNNLTLKDISLIIPQNISRSGWNFYCQLLGFPKENVFLDTFSDGGHLADVDYIRNLTDIRRKNRLPVNSYAVMYGTGTGTSWNAMLLQSM
ncbi:MAG: hypothetical protein GY940_39795 [bacterium]|nr:hypothetical protein [bacterium]